MYQKSHGSIPGGNKAKQKLGTFHYFRSPRRKKSCKPNDYHFSWWLKQRTITTCSKLLTAK